MSQAVSLLREIKHATPLRRRLLMEALAALPAIRLALRYITFQALIAKSSRPVSQPEIVGADREQLCADVRWAVIKACRYLPGKTVCFPRAIAAQAMLHRRRVGTELYYGAALRPELGLKTHVWLQNGEMGIVGHRSAGQYRVMACYSSRQRGLPGSESARPSPKEI